MFKLSVFPPMPRPAVSASNHFYQFAVTMPAELMTALRNRMFVVFMHKMWDSPTPHDLSTQELVDLEKWVTQNLLDEAHNLIVDGQFFGPLKRFCRAEQRLVRSYRNRLTYLPNLQYWTLLSELLDSMSPPTLVVPLSFRTHP